HATASAAEIFAGALRFYAQDSKLVRLLVLGECTNGKGSIQEVVPLSNNCAVKISTALYYLPDESCIQNQGIQPDICIEKLLYPQEQDRLVRQLIGTEKNLPGSLENVSQTLPATKVLTLDEQRIALLKSD